MFKLVYGAIFISFLVFVGWVFTVTASPWSFLLLILMPSYKSDDSDDSDKKKKIVTKETDNRFLKNE